MASGLHDTHTCGQCTCLHIFILEAPAAISALSMQGENCFPVFCTCTCSIGFKIVIMVKLFVCLDAQWYSREDVRKALTFAEYKKAQRTAAAKVAQMCKGVEKGQSLSADFNVESGELATMFIPGPFAIAHHLISTWANQDPSTGDEAELKLSSSSISNL